MNCGSRRGKADSKTPVHYGFGVRVAFRGHDMHGLRMGPDGRLLVLINFNTDLMDASEWSDDPQYPSKFSAYAYKIFTNAVIYAMSH